MNIKPSEIHYSQNTIKSTFTHGSTNKITTTLIKILKKTITVSNIPKINVMKHTGDDELKGKYFVNNGHRRLFIFKVRNDIFTREKSVIKT